MPRAATLSQLLKVRSHYSEEMGQFLKRLASLLDVTPWSFGGVSLKTSSAFVEPTVLTSHAKAPENSADNKVLERTKKQENLWQTNRPASARTDAQQMKIDERIREEGSYKELSWSRAFRPSLRKFWTLLGEPGAGKSCVTRYTILQLARKSLSDLESGQENVAQVPLPIWITAAHLLEQPRDISTEEAVIGALERQSGWRGVITVQMRDHLVRRVKQNGCVLIVDALDELHDSETKTIPSAGGAAADVFSSRLIELSRAPISMLLTCRTLQWDRLKRLVPWEDAETLELRRLSVGQQHEYVDSFFQFCCQTPLAGGMKSWLKKQTAVGEHAHSPLILTFACGLFMKGGMSGGASLQTLYHQILLSLLEGAWRHNKDALPAWVQKPVRRERLRLFLGPLAWPLFVASPSVNRFSLEAWTLAWHQAQVLKPSEVPGVDDMLEDLCQLGLLVEGGTDETGQACWSFAHRTLLEFLVADYLASEDVQRAAAIPPAGWRSLATKAVNWVKRSLRPPTPLDWLLRERCPFRHAPEWHQVLRFLAVLLPKPDKLLKAIGKWINFGAEDVFLSLYFLQKDLVSFMPLGTSVDRLARQRGEAWLERWTTILLFRDELVQERDFPLPLNVSGRQLTSMRFMNGRLLWAGYRTAQHPAAAEIMVAGLSQMFQEAKAGKLDAIRHRMIAKRRRVQPNLDAKVEEFTFSIAAEEFRLRVVETLGELECEAAMPILMEVLQSTEEPDSLRAKAAFALNKNSSSAAVDALIEALNSKEWPKTREAAANALGIMGFNRAIPALLEAISPVVTNHGKLRYAAAEAIAKINSNEAEVVRGLEEALHPRRNLSAESGAREEVPLSNFTGEAFMKELNRRGEQIESQMLDSAVPSVAVEALLQIHSEATLDVVLEAMRSSDLDDDVRCHIAYSLGSRDSARAFDALTGLIASDSAQPEEVRAAAILGLGKMKNQRCLPVLLDLLTSQQRHPETIHKAAAEALGTLGMEEAIGPLADALCDNNGGTEVRVAAAKALGKIGSDAAADALFAMPYCPNEEIRQAMGEAFYKIGPASHIELFRNALNPDRPFSGRRGAAEVLGRIGSDLVVDELLVALNPRSLTDEEEERWDWISMNHMRKEAARALGRIRSEKAVAGLLEALSPAAEYRALVERREQERFQQIEARRTITPELLCEDWEVRATAARALQQIGAASSANRLLAIAQADDEDHWQVRLWTREALQAICNQHAITFRASRQCPALQDITVF